MSWDGNSLRSAPEERTKNIYFSNVDAFFSRGSRNENERKVEKKSFLDVWYWEKGKFSYVREMIRAHFACNAVRAKKKIANSQFGHETNTALKSAFLANKEHAKF